MAEKCTNTSSPLVRWINPYPFAPLNHFTVPFSRSLTVNSFRSVVAFLQLGCPAGSASGRKRPGRKATRETGAVPFGPEKERAPEFGAAHNSAKLRGLCNCQPGPSYKHS